MVAAVLKFGGSLTPSDPQKNAVVIIGQPRYLSKINFSDVKMKLEPRVNEEVMYIDDTLQQLNWHNLEEEFEDTKEVIRIRISKNRQHNGQKKKDKRRKNDLQDITHKTKDQVTQTSLKTGDELRCSGRISSSFSTNGTCRVI